MTTRKQFRDAVAASVADVFAGTVLVGRNIDIRDLTEYVHIYIDTGEINDEIQIRLVELNMIVTYAADVGDDALDIEIDAIHASILDTFLSKLALEGSTDGAAIFPNQIEYGPDDSQLSSVSYTYKITYTA